MNVLAPVADGGRLRPAISRRRRVLGFLDGRVPRLRPGDRKRAMHDRVGGATCPWLTLEEW